jgi:hypothetical protein
MTEIKGLQLNQSIVELYIKQMQTCHGLAIKEMAGEGKRKEKKLEADIAYLMEEVQALRREGNVNPIVLSCVGVAILAVLVALGRGGRRVGKGEDSNN